MKRALAIGLVLAALGGCKVKEEPPITEPYKDDFSRDELGADYYNSGGDYQIVDGRLRAQKGYNHPLWLRKTLPHDVQIDVDVWAGTAIGDVKVEFFGDGKSHAFNKGAYTSTGYVAVFGGWSNSRSILTRREEHGHQLSEDKTRRKVIPNHKYHWTIVRKGQQVSWSMDGQPFLTYDDPKPLAGPGHDHFAFASWESPTFFDNLVITPLSPK